jgi:hypothetical protein
VAAIESARDGVVRELPGGVVVRARGRTLEAHARAGLGAPWFPETRLDDAALRTKLLEMTESLAPEWGDRVRELAALVGRLAEVDDVRAVGRTLRPAPAADERRSVAPV